MKKSVILVLAIMILIVFSVSSVGDTSCGDATCEPGEEGTVEMTDDDASVDMEFTLEETQAPVSDKENFPSNPDESENFLTSEQLEGMTADEIYDYMDSFGSAEKLSPEQKSAFDAADEALGKKMDEEGSVEGILSRLDEESGGSEAGYSSKGPTAHACENCEGIQGSIEAISSGQTSGTSGIDALNKEIGDAEDLLGRIDKALENKELPEGDREKLKAEKKQLEAQIASAEELESRFSKGMTEEEIQQATREYQNELYYNQLVGTLQNAKSPEERQTAWQDYFKNTNAMDSEISVDIQEMQDKQFEKFAEGLASGSGALGQAYLMIIGGVAEETTSRLYLAIDEEGGMYAHDDEGNEIPTGWHCRDCKAGLYGPESMPDGSQLVMRDGTVVDVVGTGKGQQLQTRLNFWPRGSFIDYAKGSYVTAFAKSLFGAIGDRCYGPDAFCKEGAVYEFFGKMNIGISATEAICDNVGSMSDLGDSILISKDGGKSTAWAKGEVTRVGDICAVFEGNIEQYQNCVENQTVSPYVYKLQAYVNAQQTRLKFNICVSNRNNHCEHYLLKLNGVPTSIDLDPNNKEDIELYGPPILDWHGQLTKVFGANGYYKYVCIEFDNFENKLAGPASVFANMEDKWVCDKLPLTENIAADDRSRRQWEKMADTTTPGFGGGRPTFEAPGTLPSTQGSTAGGSETGQRPMFSADF